MVHSRAVCVMEDGFAELGVTTNFSFLHGGSHPAEYVAAADELGLRAVGIADRNSMAGVVRAHVEAKKRGFRLLVGTRLVLQDGFEVIAYPQDRIAYGRLTKLLTTGNRRAPKGECHLHFSDLSMLETGQFFIVMPPDDLVMPPDDLEIGFQEQLSRFRTLFTKHVYLALTPSHRGNDLARFEALATIADRTKTLLVATNDVVYHIPNRRPLQDVLTCIREHVKIDEAGFRLQRNAERYLKPANEMLRLLKGYEDVVARTLDFVQHCTFNLDDLAHNYPDEAMGDGATPFESLETLTWKGADKRFPEGVSDKIRSMIRHELAVIADQNFAPFFLTVYDVVRYARSLDPPILCQGRGSSANSVVCYCLGITSVNPEEIDLLFERFVSAKRGEPPDIDVDFEHERREEVIQYIYEKYKRDHAGIAATVIHYRTRSAINDVGKVMGLSADVIQYISGMVWGWSASPPSKEEIQKAGLDPRDRRLRQAMILIGQLIGFPRHLSQHVGGFVITHDPLDEIVPIANAAMEDRTVIEWDKDDLDALNMLKVDVLALGMLTCIQKALDLLQHHYGEHRTLATIPRDDTPTYDMVCRADTVGVFQIESRAQMSMLPRLRPRTFYDLVIEIAIVRPGPIQGGMVHPYLKRRQNPDLIEYPSKKLEGVLKKTLGVPLFQEQAMKIAIIGAGFQPEQADALRRAITGFRHHGTIPEHKDNFITGMLANGYDRDFAESCFKQIEGFSDYGFPESHSASFALLAYASSWLKCHYPDVFACALLNSQPMGFYSASSIVRDLREHDGVIRPVDINHSYWDHTLEPLEKHQGETGCKGNRFALRLGLRQVSGFREDVAERLVKQRGDGFQNIRNLHIRTQIDNRALQNLAHADAFRSIDLDRRQALWEIKGLAGLVGKKSAQHDLPLFNQGDGGILSVMPQEEQVNLPALRAGEHVVEDYSSLHLSLKAHPVSFMRLILAKRGVVPTKALEDIPNGRRVTVAGLVLVRQRPGTAKGVIFTTLEDENGIANIIIWPKVFQKQRNIVMGSRMIAVEGHVQKEQGVIHVVARRLINLTDELMRTLEGEPEPSHPMSQPTNLWRHPRNTRVLPKGRNFH